MSAKSMVVALPLENSVKILKWKVKEGTIVSIGRVILLYEPNPSSGQQENQKLKATAVGTVRKLLAMEGDVVQPGCPLLELEKCTHPTVMKDMCAECGADLRNEIPDVCQNAASIPMVHSVPELKVNAEQAKIIGKADEERLLETRKLVLLVDLDQTLIHTTNDNIPPNLKDVHHFQLHGSLSPWHHTRLRPGTLHFLQEMSNYYELHICTFGSRMYAHTIARVLDPKEQYFSHRILSRDECFSSNSKTANLKALFPCGDNMVCIIDDREDVWNFAPNLIHVKPYHFFQHTGDINAPPGLAKLENDDTGEYDFNCLGDGIKKSSSEIGSKDVTDSVKSKPCIKEIETEEKSEETVTESVKTENEIQKKECDDKVSENDEQSINKKTEITIEDNVQEKNDLSVEIAVKDSIPESNKPDSDDTEMVKEEPRTNSESIVESSSTASLKDSPECLSTELMKESSNQILEDEKVIKADSEINRLSDDKTDTENLLEIKEDCEIKKPVDETDDALIPTEIKPINNAGGKSDDIEVNDGDDYLLYLEDILKRIHREFYDRLDKGLNPDMKEVVPAVRKKVLANTSLVFSGLVPSNMPLERSRAYQVAISLGAHVTQDLNKNTTHLVAVRPGTAKVISGRRMKGLLMVTADWLWTCAERWERVEEKVFPLVRNKEGRRHPPAHCGSPEHAPISSDQQPQVTSSTGRARTASGRFMDTINPLLSFSSADIADMDQEVNDIFNESESDGEGEGADPKDADAETGSDAETQNIPSESTSVDNTFLPHKLRQGGLTVEDSESSSSSADSLSGEHPHGWGKHNLKRRHADFSNITTASTATATESDGDDDADDIPSAKFRRGEALPSDLDLGENDSESQGSQDPPDEMDDGDWNMMGAALEREFLS